MHSRQQNPQPQYYRLPKHNGCVLVVRRKMTSASLKCGTYRIVHSSGGAAIQAMDDDPTKMVVWKCHEGENQQWFVQRAGDGYTFKNCRHGLYFAVKNTSSKYEDRSPLHGSKYPMPWALVQQNDRYAIMFPENIKRVLCSTNYSAENGTILHLWPTENHPTATWKLEKLNDETEKLPLEHISSMGPDPQTVNIEEKPVKHQVNELERDEELGRMKDQISSMEGQLSSVVASQQEAIIRQLQEIIKVKEEVAYLRDQQAQQQIKSLQSEVADLRARMDKLEYPKSQTMSRDGADTYQGTYGGA